MSLNNKPKMEIVLRSISLKIEILFYARELA